LLYHLAAIPQLVARDRLCLLFWPDTPEATARCNLSRLVSILHSALPDPALLITSDDQIGLARQGTWSDTQGHSILKR
jgi:DNA-binding SARP family transcriptional activator